ncbi:hypothetical protein JNJ66_06570 [Candidatus Saccharibacteria bacterium]|nr:hypothetical protein [Candidatus Saccharibacteria bacterium]
MIEFLTSRSWLRRLPAALVAALVMVSGMTVLTGTAAAADGREQSVTGEITAYAVHSWDRQPDAGELQANAQYAEEDGCHQGLTQAGFRIVASELTQATWPDPRDLVGAIYAALLDREPDAGGMDTSLTNINNRGVDFAVMEVLASAEYHNRLAGICGTDTTTGGALMWNDALDLVENEVIPLAMKHGANCAFMKGFKTQTGLKKNVKGARVLIGVVGEITNKVHGKLDKTCGTALELLKVGAKIIDLTGGETHNGGYNAVYVNYRLGDKPWTAGIISEWRMQVGNNPVDVTEFDGTYPSMIGQ